MVKKVDRDLEFKPYTKANLILEIILKLTDILTLITMNALLTYNLTLSNCGSVHN